MGLYTIKSSQTSTNKRQLKILVIEDDEVDFLVTKKNLLQIEGMDFSVDWAINDLEAHKLIEHSPAYDLIFIDYYIGKCTGIEILNEFQKSHINTPTIVLTNFWDREIDMETIRSGASDFIVKSELSPSLLDRSIRYAIERHNMYQTLQKLTQIDPLTELLNRRGLEEVLEAEISNAKRQGSSPVVMLVDVDDFKNINDTFGHSVGDILLKEMSNSIKECLRQTDYAARIGGDEFMLVLPDTRLAEGLMISERIRLSLSECPIELTTETISISASIGITAAQSDTLSIDSLLSELHNALKKSKQNGKNKVSISGSADASDSQDTITPILQELQDGSGIYSVSQPIINLEKNEIAGYEMLSRGKSPSFKTPDDFFRLCMEHNILNTVDLNCIKKGLEKIKELPDSQRIHLNIFPSTILSSFSEKIIDMIKESQANHKICLEISEQQLIGDPSYLKESIQKFKDAGITISIDDVGFGKSSLESLIFLDPDIVKIDKKCVLNVAEDKLKLSYLKRLVTVAKSLEMSIVAEGIETKEDLQVLIDLGVKYGQGYFFAKPSEEFVTQKNIS